MSKLFKCEKHDSINEELFSASKEEREFLVANSVDAAKEKHVPVVKVEENKVEVSVGSVTHPMTPEHYITFIQVVTNYATHRKDLKPTDEPTATFALLDGEKVLEVYEYCNLHGLWKC